ncbi:MAG: sensor histidine kinase [Gaiellaceae bacterium]
MTSSLARRPTFITALATAGLGLTFGAMLLFDAESKLGAVALAPWVGLMGLDAGIAGGLVATAVATSLWATAAELQAGATGAFPIGVRVVSFLLLGVGSGLVGERLRTSEGSRRNVSALHSALIDAALDGICLTDAHGRLLISNAPLRRMSAELGMPQQGTVPERLLAIADRLAKPERYRARMKELATSADAESSDEFELAGTGRCFRGYTSPVHDPQGLLVGRVWTLREVTADRELDRMRDAFVATVSHELRTPLTSISGFLEMLQDEEHSLGDAGRSYLEVIRRSTDRLHHLVEDLLLIAQIEAHRVELEPAPLDLAALASACVDASRPAAEEKRVSIEFVADHPPRVRGDAQRLAQAVDNLVSNAVKFTLEGGSVTVSVEKDGDAVHLVVADTGIGIPADEQGQVFSRFFRARTATQAAIPGTGLGLAISRALVEEHGGTIALESEEGRGTRVTVTLPADA